MSEDEMPSRARWWLIMAPLMLTSATTGVMLIAVFAVLPAIIGEFGSPILGGWIVTIFLLVAAAAAAIGGALGDLYGPKRVFKVILLLVIAGSLICLLSSGFTPMLIGRGLQGLSGGLTPLEYAIIRASFPSRRVPAGIGLIAMAAGIGSGLGMLGAGVLVDHLPWRSMFALGGLLSMLALVLVVIFCPDQRLAGSARRVDIPGGLLFVSSVSAFLLSLTVGHSGGWNQMLPWSMIAASAVLLTLWYWHEMRQASPLIDPRLLVLPGVYLPLLAVAMMGLGAMQANQLLFLLLQQPVWTGVGLGISGTLAGMIKIPSTVTGSLSGPASGRLIGRWGAGGLVAIGFLLNAAGWLCIVILPPSTMLIAILLTLCFTTGSTILAVSISAALIENVPKERVGEASGMMIVFRSVAQAVGSQVIMLLLASGTVASPTSTARFPTAGAYDVAFLFILATCLLGAAAGHLIARHARKLRSVSSMAAAVAS